MYKTRALLSILLLQLLFTHSHCTLIPSWLTLPTVLSFTLGTLPVTAVPAVSAVIFILPTSPYRWAASNWPAKLLAQMDLVYQQHAEEEEKFRKIQLMDQNNFQEKLEGLQVRPGAL